LEDGTARSPAAVSAPGGGPDTITVAAVAGGGDPDLDIRLGNVERRLVPDP